MNSLFPLVELTEKCGVFCIQNHPEAAENCVLGLHALQHRGHEGFGIVCIDNNDKFNCYYGDGYVNSNPITHKLGKAKTAIGHIRYATSGSLHFRQPMFAKLNTEDISIAHNGNLINADIIRGNLKNKGCLFQSEVDSEVFVHLIAQSQKSNLVERIIEALLQVKGAYSLGIVTSSKMIAVRDPFGIRPLVLGKLDESYVIASETCALEILGATFVRDINMGELLVIENGICTSYYPFAPATSRFCIFEYVYFARPDSILEGRHVYSVRKNIGRQLALESPIEADLIVPVPDSSFPAALGYAEESKIPFELGIIRNPYIGRTFIRPTQTIRQTDVKLKLAPNTAILSNKKIILVDDSIVRGTTLKTLIIALRKAGVKEIHLRIASPPFSNPCLYGIDTPNKAALFACQYPTLAEKAAALEVDSLCFLSIEALYKATGVNLRNEKQPQFCDACFTGQYPVSIDS